jgi:hypothetical protein
MRIGSFEVDQPLPKLNEPHAFAVVRPWVDCGSVGTLVLQWLETRFGARELASLARPGSFYDFTRYRPTTHFRDGIRELVIPNTIIRWARHYTGKDLVFLHLLEPHILGEIYANSVWQFLKTLSIKRYSLLGSFYDLVPHTRPVMISGGASTKGLQADLQKMSINQSLYEGPTTICNLISQEAEKAGVETLTLLAHLPQYTDLEEDYPGTIVIQQALHTLYGIPIDESAVQKAEGQLKAVESVVQNDRKLKALVTELENQYDSRVTSKRNEEQSNLSPEVDQFLKEMENRFKGS